MILFQIHYNVEYIRQLRLEVLTYQFKIKLNRMEKVSNKHQTATDVYTVLVDGVPLVDGEYYRINGTKKILYWDGSQWMKPVKDQQKRYGTWNTHLDKQPTNIKSVELVDIYACH